MLHRNSHSHRVQGLLEELDAEATVQPPAHVQQDGAACTTEAESEADITEAQWEKVPEPPQPSVGETPARLWHRQFAHVRNKGRQQIQVCVALTISAMEGLEKTCHTK